MKSPIHPASLLLNFGPNQAARSNVGFHVLSKDTLTQVGMTGTKPVIHSFPIPEKNLEKELSNSWLLQKDEH